MSCKVERLRVSHDFIKQAATRTRVRCHVHPETRQLHCQPQWIWRFLHSLWRVDLCGHIRTPEALPNPMTSTYCVSTTIIARPNRQQWSTNKSTWQFCIRLTPDTFKSHTITIPSCVPGSRNSLLESCPTGFAISAATQSAALHCIHRCVTLTYAPNEGRTFQNSQPKMACPKQTFGSCAQNSWSSMQFPFFSRLIGTYTRANSFFYFIHRSSIYWQHIVNIWNELAISLALCGMKNSSIWTEWGGTCEPQSTMESAPGAAKGRTNASQDKTMPFTHTSNSAFFSPALLSNPILANNRILLHAPEPTQLTDTMCVSCQMPFAKHFS